MLYNHCQVTTYHVDDAAWVGNLCSVRIDDDGSILVEYDDDGNTVQYLGRDVGGGHYVLDSKSIDGRATLHRTPKTDILEGFWIVRGYEGMWRIHLRGIQSIEI